MERSMLIRLIRVFAVAGSVATVVGVLVLAVPPAAQAASQTFSTSQREFDPGVRNQGWWSTTLPNDDANANYIVGDANQGPARNFFTFDLSSACRATSVVLQLTRFDQTGPLTYSLFDVSTPAATLNANQGISQTIFDDLGTGTSFGSFPVADGAESEVLSFPLNAAGVAGFNAARGGFFSIGGSSPEGEASGFGFLFGASGPTGTQQLVVTCLPTAKEECENGGWRNFPGFKNQGDCVSFVATEGKNPPSQD